jgi:pyruvate/2-oxoglutarate dehydrogenase complex dihydrolipoamide acyltransferase (E2) component
MIPPSRNADDETRIDKLPISAKFMRSGLRVTNHAGAVCQKEILVDEAAAKLEILRGKGVRITWTHIFVRAAALALTRHPEVNKLTGRSKTMYSSRVDIAVSIDSEAAVTPVLIVRDAANSSVYEIAARLSCTEEQKKEADDMWRLVNKFGWLLPTSFLREFVIRHVSPGRPESRREMGGTFQLTSLPEVDVLTPLLFNTTAAFGIGGVRQRPWVDENGQLRSGLSVIVSCPFDHAVINGRQAARFLETFAAILSEGSFMPEKLIDGAEFGILQENARRQFLSRKR